MTEKVTHIRLKWAGGVHRFKLDFDLPPLPAGLSVRDAALVGPPRLHDHVRLVLARLVGQAWGVEDVAHTILVGLIGGGEIKRGRPDSEPYAEANALVREHVLKRPLAESTALAQTILMAAIAGVPAHLADQGLEPLTFDLDPLDDETPDREAA